MQNHVLCFMDWQKEFGPLNGTKLMQILKEIGFDLHVIKLISRLYIDQNVRMRLSQWEKRSVNIGRGIRQGWSLSPILFNLCSENLTKGAVEGFGDFRIKGQRIHTANMQMTLYYWLMKERCCRT